MKRFDGEIRIDHVRALERTMRSSKLAHEKVRKGLAAVFGYDYLMACLARIETNGKALKVAA